MALDGCVDHIRKPLLWELLPLLLYWQIVEACWMGGDELLDLLNGERLVLRDGQVLDGILLDLLLGSGDEVLKETWRRLDKE